MLGQTPAKSSPVHAIASLDGARGDYAPPSPPISRHAERPSALGWLHRLFASKKNDRLILATYMDLYDADDHILRDVGVTRLEVARLIEQSRPR